MIPRLASALRRTAQIAADRPRAALWTVVAVTCALFALGLAAVTADNVDRWTSVPRGGASMVVYLGEDVDAMRAQDLVRELAKLPGLEHAELVAPAETARRLEAALGSPGQTSPMLEGVDLASLPGSVEVTLAPGVKDVIALSPTVRALRGTQGVEDVVVEDDGADRRSDTLAAVRAIAWIGAAVLSGLAVILVLAQIRVRLERDRREQRVLHLLGASPAFSLVPTALAGALLGLLSSLLAAGALAVVMSAYGDVLAGALSGALGTVEIVAPALGQITLFVALGALLGGVGGGLAGASRVAR